MSVHAAQTFTGPHDYERRRPYPKRNTSNTRLNADHGSLNMVQRCPNQATMLYIENVLELLRLAALSDR